MSKIRRITGGPILFSRVALAPSYKLCQEGDEFAAGRVGMGPFAGNETTVCLNPGDDGKWFTDQVEKLGGTWKLYE